ncbi:uncharacterized protein LOC119692223 [Plutella xylostella]|uniref:uncharacterized protein LOC119692223 n=1 Tax=Plutella xylostella TaxID=51655 RepID=UPI002032B664|nr:uncharacterized protein LOC119692223 [Plutella xylostella]
MQLKIPTSVITDRSRALRSKRARSRSTPSQRQIPGRKKNDNKNCHSLSPSILSKRSLVEVAPSVFSTPEKPTSPDPDLRESSPRDTSVDAPLADSKPAAKAMRIPVRQRPVTATKSKIRPPKIINPSSHTMELLLPAKRNVDPTSDASIRDDQKKESENNVTLTVNHGMPHTMITKLMRQFAIKKREFLKLKRTLIPQQNQLLTLLAALRELEAGCGAKAEDALYAVTVLSVAAWPPHDVLLLVARDDAVCHGLAQTAIKMLTSQLDQLPEELHKLGAELWRHGDEHRKLARYEPRERSLGSGPYRSSSNYDQRLKDLKDDEEEQKMIKMIEAATENFKHKISRCLTLTKAAWCDRDVLTKKVEKLQKELVYLQHKAQEARLDARIKTPRCSISMSSSRKDSRTSLSTDPITLAEELKKERSAREALREVVTTAESMLRVARARIAILERQLKESKLEVANCQRKQKELEQICRFRESSYDARSKKLLEMSKTGEMTIETLSRQRDALEIRVRELREEADAATRRAEEVTNENATHIRVLKEKIADQEKVIEASRLRTDELDQLVTALQTQLAAVRERTADLVDMERRRCLDFVPSKESEPSDRETELWQELTATRAALARADRELLQARQDKEGFLESLARIAQVNENADKLSDKMASELVTKERKIMSLQQRIERHLANEAAMTETIEKNDSQIAAMKLEMTRMQSYSTYNKETFAFPELQHELNELQMKVDALTRERSALVSAAASRALLLERHERAADLFARMTRMRRELGATVRPDSADAQPRHTSSSLAEICSTASESWSALRAERGRVLLLERALVTQGVLMERQARLRTRLERHRAALNRELMGARMCQPSDARLRRGGL